MTWGLIWLMLVLKIPVAALLWIVWWAVHQVEEPDTGADGDGGTKVSPHGHRPLPPRPPRRRGPHGDPAPAAPRRVRTTVVRSRQPHRV
jgi:hypothetical protein